MQKAAPWVLRALGVGFALFGALFAFAPQATLEYFSQWGTALGWEATSPEAGGFWRVLAVAFMVIVTVLAFWGSVPSPAQPALLMMLFIGKASSSLGALLFYWLESPQFLYLLNFVVDGAIALIVLWCRQVLKKASP
ncbi:hypothetical protein GBSOP10_108210 [Armatimonadetes bacterium GBS]|jgi:hypothetical protein|nr:hypothetical protein GBSOP10_108210 [Armatimonadetes bacterium GBS]CUU34213.1 hypothetical protein GXSOP10_1132 [Armatimonadetes bacterium GXS]